MSNFPFETFPLTKRVGIVNPVANLDARYGPWPTFNDALTGFSSLLRQTGLTVAVSGVGGIKEYWYKNGVANENLILKIEETGSISLSADLQNTVTLIQQNSGTVWTDKFELKTENFTCISGKKYLINTQTVPITATLPSSPEIGDSIVVQDPFLTWNTNFFTINKNTQMIQGHNENLICDLPGLSLNLVYVGSTIGWRVD